MLRLVTSITIILCLCAGVGTAGTCPPDTLQLAAMGIPSGPASLLVGTASAGALSHDYPVLHASYSLSERRVAASASLHAAYNSGEGPAHATVGAHDVYTLVGPVSPLAITFTARLKLTAWCAGGTTYSCNSNDPCTIPAGTVSVRLTEGAANSADYVREINGPDTTQIAITITRRAGQTFDLAIACQVNADFAGNPWLDVGSDREASVMAQLEFSDLPAGYELMSCQGSQTWADVPVCTAPGAQAWPIVAGDGNGGAFIAWSDPRGVEPAVYLQHLDRAGRPAWVAQGMALDARSPAETSLLPDGSGGLFVVWQEIEPTGYSSWATRLGPDGLARWGDGPVRLCSSSLPSPRPTLIDDGVGGAIAVWMDARGMSGNTEIDVYAQRFGPMGGRSWPENGVAVGVAPGNQMFPSAAPDGVGGAYVIWSDGRSGAGSRAFAQHVAANGDRLWGESGMEVSSIPSTHRGPAVVTGPSGEAIVVWLDSRSADGGPGVYAQRFSMAGLARWAANGQRIGGGDTEPRVIPDGYGGAIVCWGNTPRLQRVSPAGTPLWGAEGVSPFANMYSWGYELASDGAGGVFVVPAEPMPVPADLIGQHVDALGVPHWEGAGVLLNSAPSHVRSARVAADGRGGVIVVWLDERGVGGDDLYALRLPLVPTGIGGPVPTLVDLFHLEDTAAGVVVRWSLSDEDAADGIRPERGTGEAGEWRAVHGTPRVQGRVRELVDIEAAAGVTNWYRLAGILPNGQRVSEAPLSIVPRGASTFALEPPGPNPADRTTRVVYSLPRAGHVHLSILDIQGRELARLTDADRAAGQHVATLTVNDLSAGLYFLRLAGLGEERTRRVLVMR
ncbi:MAG: T9SS type A sorting domain-containing protein [Candidatus Eisenbacteria bacterium]